MVWTNQAASMAQLRVLGPFELAVEDTDNKSLNARKAQALLCYLVIHRDQAISREKLASLLWTDTASEFARTNLRQSISVLRKALGPKAAAIVSEASTLRYDSSILLSDVQQFEEQKQIATTDSLQAASILYRGELLEGNVLDGCTMQDWLERERHRLQQDWILICHSLLVAYSDSGDHKTEYNLANRLLDVDNLNEPAYRSIMQYHASQDCRHLALQQYEICKELLDTNLSVAPEQKTQQLYNEILNQGELIRGDIDVVPTSITDIAPTIVGGEIGTSRFRSVGLLTLLVVTVLTLLGVSQFYPVSDAADRADAELEMLLSPEAGLKQASNLPTIAVLPFSNVSGDDDQDYFGEGLSEDLITDLSKVSGLKVLARTSTFSFRDTVLNLTDVATELEADYLFYGSFRKINNRVRINAQLMAAKEGTHLWAERFDRKFSDVLKIQDELSQTIVTQLAVTLTASEQEELERSLAVNVDAHDLFLRSLRPIRELTKEGSEEARRILKQVIDIDRTYARAHANLALTYAQDINFGFTKNVQETLEQGINSATIAEKLDNTSPHLYFSLSVLHLAGRNYAEAKAAAIRAIQLDPYYADGYGTLGQVLMFSGDLVNASKAIEKAKLLNPGFTFTYLWLEGQVLLLAGKYEQARDVFQEINERNPSFESGRLLLIAALGLLGEIDEAEWEIDELLTISPDFSLEQERYSALYRLDEHTQLYIAGLKSAGLK